MMAVPRALELNVNSAYVCMHAGYCHAFSSAPDEGIQWFERAKLLSPLDPLTFHIHTGMATVYLMAQRPQEAYDHASRSLAENANWIVTKRYLVSACGHLGRTDESRAIVANILEITAGANLDLAAAWCPSQDKVAYDYYLDGLRKAGLT